MSDISVNIHNINEKNSPCIYDTWENHLGAYFDTDGNTIFKLFTFPDVLNVRLELKPKNKNIQIFNMNNTGNGIWQLILEKGVANHEDRYRYVITYASGEVVIAKDPCSMYQEAYFKWSKLYNHSLFNWTDNKWTCFKDTRRVSKLANETNMLSNVQSLMIYELHIGTFTEEGTFNAAKEKLADIANYLKFNAIEIMPVENTYSFNWGYDGVDKYAPNHTYGTPDDLKDLINHAHNLGLNVIMDIVPNHLGPDIAQLHKTGPYIEGENCFGYKFNFENEYSSTVRDFITGAALNWLINYHCDGLRVDMTKFMCSDYTMKQMVAEINYHCPNAFLIAEDGRDNDLRVTRVFTQNEIDENELNHTKFINKIKGNNISLANLGFDTEWDFPFHKQIAALILGSWDCRIKNLCNFDYSLRAAQSRVKYIMSHDEIGNIDGTRLICKIMANELNLHTKMCDCCHTEKCKRVAHAAHHILVALLTGELEKMTEEEQSQFFASHYLKENLSIEDIFSAFLNALRMHKLALGKIYSIPGPKMVFQGDEEANISYFKFFRKFSCGPEPYLLEKGYEPGLPAFIDSKLNAVKFSKKYEAINFAIRHYMRDLNLLCAENQALRIGNIQKTIVHEYSYIHGIFSKYLYNEIFAVSNFTKQAYNKNYGILFPKGQWKEVLNSDDIKYYGSGQFHNIEQTKEPYNYISIAPYSIVFFKRI